MYSDPHFLRWVGRKVFFSLIKLSFTSECQIITIWLWQFTIVMIKQKTVRNMQFINKDMTAWYLSSLSLKSLDNLFPWCFTSSTNRNHSAILLSCFPVLLNSLELHNDSYCFSFQCLHLLSSMTVQHDFHRRVAVLQKLYLAKNHLQRTDIL